MDRRGWTEEPGHVSFSHMETKVKNSRAEYIKFQKQREAWI